jgi:hypothetical protein
MITLLSIILALAIFFGTIRYSAIKEEKLINKRWNDGNCICGTGSLKFDRMDDYHEVGYVFVYKCTSCERESTFLRNMG